MALYLIKKPDGIVFRVYGTFKEVFDSQSGTRSLVGWKKIKTLNWPKAVEKVYKAARIDITNCTYKVIEED